jgi:hypothetical protein
LRELSKSGLARCSPGRLPGHFSVPPAGKRAEWRIVQVVKRTLRKWCLIAFFQYCRPCAGRRRRQWRSRGGTNCRSGFTKEPEAAGQGAPARTAPGPAVGESRRQSARGVYGSQLYYRSLAPAACTAGRGLGRQWPPPTGDGSGTPGHVCIGSGSTTAE